jgi:outer membrane autotransporter protein
MKLDVTRTIGFGALSRVTGARVDVNGFGFAAEARYGLGASESWTLGPLARISYADATLDSFAEAGAGSLDLAAGANDHSRVRVGLGAFARFAGVSGMLDLAAGYSNGDDEPTEIGLNLAGAPGTPFRVRSARGEGEGAFGQVGAAFALGGGWSVGGSVRGQFGADGRRVAGNVDIGWRF